MQLIARLVHAEAGQRVVEVRACEGEKLLGSALGEAADAETAEDRARQRLLNRLQAPAAAPLPPAPSLTRTPAAALDAAAKDAAALAPAAASVQRARPTAPLGGSEAASSPAVPSVSRPRERPSAIDTASRPAAPPPATGPGRSETAGGASAADPATAASPAMQPTAAALSGSPAGGQPPAAEMAAPAMGAADPAQAASAANSSGLAATHGMAMDNGQPDGAGPDPESEREAEAVAEPATASQSAEALSGRAAQAHAPDAHAADGHAGDNPGRSAPLLRRSTESPPAAAAPAPEPARASPLEPAPDPEDWSSDLAALDLQLRRLGWDREREATYLQRAFGHPSRNRLTQYRDLRAYLHTLEGLAPGSEPASAPVPLRRSELLSQCDALLAQLSWNAELGRAFLERELQVASRQQLNDQQLLHFNMLLESETLNASSPQDPVVP